MTQNEGRNFGSSSRALGAFDQRGPYGILIHLGVDFVKMNESQFRAENPAAKYPLPYWQQLLRHDYEFYYVFYCVEKKAFRAFVFYVSKLSFIIQAKPTEVAPQMAVDICKA